MSNKNYTRYSKMSGDEPTLDNEVALETNHGLIVDDIVQIENESVVIEDHTDNKTMVFEVESVVEPEVIPEPKNMKLGKVHGCKKLNIRNMPNREAKVLTEVIEGSEVMIDVDGSTATFYKICTECGIDGYCMKQYIKVLS